VKQKSLLSKFDYYGAEVRAGRKSMEDMHEDARASPVFPSSSPIGLYRRLWNSPRSCHQQWRAGSTADRELGRRSSSSLTLPRRRCILLL